MPNTAKDKVKTTTRFRVNAERGVGVSVMENVSLLKLKQTIDKHRKSGSTVPGLETESWAIQHVIDQVNEVGKPGYHTTSKITLDPESV